MQALGLEGSTGTWEKVEEDTEEVRKAMSSKMVGYHEIPSDDPSVKSAVVQLAFPIRAWGDNIPMMLLAIAGNCFAYSKHIMLTDVFIGKELLKKFQGPKFGINGIRKLTGVKDRPLSLHIIKPKMGMTPEQTANQVRLTALGGADLCKDDEMLGDAYNNTMEQRLPLVMKEIDRAAQKTGKRMIYMCSITDEPQKMMDKARPGDRLRRQRAVGYLFGRPGRLPRADLAPRHQRAGDDARLAHDRHDEANRLARAGQTVPAVRSGHDAHPHDVVVNSDGLDGRGAPHLVREAGALGPHQADLPHAVCRRVSGPGRGDYRRVRAGHHYSGRRRHVGPSGRLHGRRPIVAAGHCRGDGRRALARGGAQARKPPPAAGAGEMGLHGAAQDALVAAGARLSAEGDEVRRLRICNSLVVGWVERASPLCRFVYRWTSKWIQAGGWLRATTRAGSEKRTHGCEQPAYGSDGTRVGHVQHNHCPAKCLALCQSITARPTCVG